MTEEHAVPKWAALTADSTREEVLAAVAESEQRRRDLTDYLAAGAAVTACRFDDEEDEIDVWSRTAYGDVTNIRAFDRHMAQVGEEDQTEPGWDAGP